MNLTLLITLIFIINQQIKTIKTSSSSDDYYYYTRTREDPQHLRISEEFKNSFLDDVKIESTINGTKYEYYKSKLTMNYDELVFETIDKMFQHRLSPFYIHHYDNDLDKKLSSDPSLVSNEACARDLMYLIDKLPNKNQIQPTKRREPYTNNDEDHLTPELSAFFDSYARQEAGLLMGNTYWVGAYDQCINRHIVDVISANDWQQKYYPQQQQQQQQQSDQQLNEPNQQQQQQVISFKGRYCVSSLKSPTWDSLIESKKLRSRKYFKTERQFNDYSKLFRLQVGICLPQSCDSSSIERHLDELKLLTTSMLDQRYNDYELIDLYCLPDETSPLRSLSGSALCFVIFISIWCSMLLVATLADCLEIVDTDEGSDELIRAKSNGSPSAPAAISDDNGKQPRLNRPSKGGKFKQFVIMFSLRANYRKFMKVSDDDENEKDNGRSNIKTQQNQQQQQIERKQPATSIENKTTTLKVNLRFLNSFKVLIMFWIINGHIMLLMIQTAKNILYSDALCNGFMHLLIGATFGVDLFFTMTGFLTSYLLFNSSQAFKLKPISWIYLSFYRYWRLAPMYLIAFWFSRSVIQLLGSGPLWDYGTASLTFRGLCNHESWWYPLTLTSNLHGLFEECMITSWYISCDMQFWLISPIYIYLLSQSAKGGWLAALSTIYMSSKMRYDSILAESSSARYDELVKPRADIFMRVSHDMHELYTQPQFRISAYLVGLLAGHYVYMIKSGKWKSPISYSCCQQQQSISATTTTTSNAMISYENRSSTKLEEKGSKLRNTMAYTGLFLFIVMSYVSYILSRYYPVSLMKYSKQFAAIAYSVDHLAMSFGASLVIISMCFGKWSNIVKFLSHPNWTRLSKLNYALLLLQCEFIYYQFFIFDQVPVAGTKELITYCFTLLFTLYPSAFIATLAFEFPLANVKRLLI